MCLGARALPVDPLLAVDRRLLGCKRVGVTSNSYAESDDSTSYLPDNGDDCEGILPPIRRSK